MEEFTVKKKVVTTTTMTFAPRRRPRRRNPKARGNFGLIRPISCSPTLEHSIEQPLFAIPETCTPEDEMSIDSISENTLTNASVEPVIRRVVGKWFRICKWGQNCPNDECPFPHDDYESMIMNNHGGKTKLCKFGSDCTRADCAFAHSEEEQQPRIMFYKKDREERNRCYTMSPLYQDSDYNVIKKLSKVRKSASAVSLPEWTADFNDMNNHQAWREAIRVQSPDYTGSWADLI